MPPIILTEPSGGGAEALRFFPGRSLGENEFDIIQTYAASRASQLLAGATPGIVHGLSITIDEEGAVTVEPGLAVGSDGRPIRLFAPLRVDFPAVVEEYVARTGDPDNPQPVTGWFRLTVKRGLMVIDPPSEAKAATRTDLDILRDSRVETLATLDLHLVSAAQGLMDMDVPRAVNRLAVRALTEGTFNAPDGAVPLALVKVVDGEIVEDEGAPVVDGVAGRFLAREGAAAAALLAAHTAVMVRLDRRREAPPVPAIGPPGLSPPVVVGPPGLPPETILPGRLSGGAPPFLGRTRTPTLPGRPRSALSPLLPGRPIRPSALSRFIDPALLFDPERSLADQLGVDYLPPAGPLPRGILREIAGRPQGTAWRGAELRFDPLDLQIELAPIRASEVAIVEARELRRGVVDLVHTQGDRIRILVAVPDAQFSPTLMDLPATDRLLEEAIYRRAAQARAAWQAWADAYKPIFGGLDEDALEEGTPTDDARALFKSIRIPAPPAGALPALEGASGAAAELGVAPPVAPPQDGSAFFSGLIAQRSGATGTTLSPIGRPTFPGGISDRSEGAVTPVRPRAPSTLPRPYSQGIPLPPDDFEPVPVDTSPPEEPGLYAQRARLQAEIAALEDELDANDRLVADFDVFIRAQRQGFDSITVSFTSLAGGVPGDGSGLQLTKWLPFTQLNVVDPG